MPVGCDKFGKAENNMGMMFKSDGLLLAAAVVLAILAVAPVSESAGRRISQRTTWPTETGTMVRILKRAGLSALTRAREEPKRDLFLRTNRALGSNLGFGMELLGEDEEDKRNGAGDWYIIPARGQKQENPIFLRSPSAPSTK